MRRSGRPRQVYDVVIVGGGPAGLCAGIAAARAGYSARVLERELEPVDKACGEGLLPPALGALERLGVLGHLRAGPHFRLRDLEYIDAGGSRATATFPAPGGLGVRRTLLAHALATSARQVGAELSFGCSARELYQERDRIIVQSARGPVEGKLLVAADGLHSAVRRRAGIPIHPMPLKRYGMRSHFSLAPWSAGVELHLGKGVEAYVTPVSASSVGVAFLWNKDAIARPVTFEALLRRFPMLSERLRGAHRDTLAVGAGPLWQRAPRITGRRMLLLGDAAGYVDAITGEGLSLAFESAELFGELLPALLSSHTHEGALREYARGHHRLFRRYAFITRAVLGIARHEPLRASVIRALGRHPEIFNRLVAWALQLPWSSSRSGVRFGKHPGPADDGEPSTKICGRRQ